jgi:hypothetical protein
MNDLPSNRLLARHLQLISSQEISNLNKEDTLIYLTSLVAGLHEYPSDHPSLLLLVTRLRALELAPHLHSVLELQSQLMEALLTALKTIL